MLPFQINRDEVSLIFFMWPGGSYDKVRFEYGLYDTIEDKPHRDLYTLDISARKDIEKVVGAIVRACSLLLNHAANSVIAPVFHHLQKWRGNRKPATS
jgi:hypothetical protein